MISSPEYTKRSEPKSITVGVRFAPTERAVLDRVAESTGWTISQFVRAIVLASARSILFPNTDLADADITVDESVETAR